MSFYVYYGKLKEELLVAVLPNGTVEHNDPIFLYTKKLGLTSHKATDVKVTADSEDLVNFKDNQSAYQLVTKKAYKELTLTINAKTGNTSTVALTRHYDQPFTAIPASDPPRIWTGTVDFQSWAKGEAFFVIVPKGLGNGKPVVSIWQWTQDADKGERSLTYSTSTQQSQTATPNIFSFKQNGYYTLDCRINTKTDGLAVTIKNKDSTQKADQKELKLAEKITVGAEHKLSPPPPPTTKITLECSYPKPTSSLKRYVGALPFPGDLVETLRHSAAYVDQAGYLANHAVNQFNQLDRSFQMLEKKAEARSAKIIVLEGDIARHVEANKVLEAKNKALQKQFDDYRAAAEKKEADLEAELQRLKKVLDAANAEIDRLKRYIEKDKVDDEKKRKENEDHDLLDHERIKKLQEELAISKAAEARAQQKIKDLEAALADLKIVVRDLEQKVRDKDTTIAGLEAELISTKQRLEEKTKEAAELKAQLTTVTTERNKLATDLKNEKYNHSKTKEALLAAEKDAADKQQLLEKAEAANTKLQQDLDQTEEDYAKARKDRDEAQDKVNEVRGDLRKKEDRAQRAINDLQGKQDELNKLRASKDTEIKDLKDKLKKADADDREHHGGIVTHDVKDTIGVSAIEIGKA